MNEQHANSADATSRLDDTALSTLPVDIPSPHPRTTGQRLQSDFDDATARAIVGSPEDDAGLPSQSFSEYYTPRTAAVSPYSAANPAGQAFPGTSRPVIARSVTSPSAPAEGRSRASSSIGASAVSSSFRFGQPSNRDKRKDDGREWTVFGELIGSVGVDGDDRNRQSASSSSAVQRPGARESLKDFIVGRSGLSHANRSSLIQSTPSTPGYELHASTASMATEPEDSSTIRALDDLSDDESETQSIHSIVPQLSKEPKSGWCSCLPTLTLSPLARNILKCCIAYFIGSLFTYSPYLSGFIADIKGGDPGERIPSPSGHMVSTVYVLCSHV